MKSQKYLCSFKYLNFVIEEINTWLPTMPTNSHISLRRLPWSYGCRLSFLPQSHIFLRRLQLCSHLGQCVFFSGCTCIVPIVPSSSPPSPWAPKKPVRVGGWLLGSVRHVCHYRRKKRGGGQPLLGHFHATPYDFIPKYILTFVFLAIKI